VDSDHTGGVFQEIAEIGFAVPAAGLDGDLENALAEKRRAGYVSGAVGGAESAGAEEFGDAIGSGGDGVTDQQAGGQVPKWVSPDAVAALVLAVVNGVVVAEVVDPDGPGHREVAAELFKLLLASNGNAPGQAP